MRNRVLNRIIYGFILLVIIVALFGKVTVAASSSGQTAASFLRIGMGAPGAGMGGAYTAVATGVDAAYWNPSQLNEIGSAEISLSHFSWYQDITVEQGAVGFGLTDNLAGAVAITFLNYGDIEGYNLDGTSTGQNISAYDFTAGFSLGMNINDNFAAGITAKYVSQNLDDITAATYAFDLAGTFKYDKFTIAAVLANAGPQLDFEGHTEKLPTAVRFGVAMGLLDNRLVASLEVDNQFEGELSIRQGLQMSFSNEYYLRTGFDLVPGGGQSFMDNGANFGAGMIFGRMKIDYAFSPDDHYSSGNLHRISLSLGLR